MQVREILPLEGSMTLEEMQERTHEQRRRDAEEYRELEVKRKTERAR